jgi:hypothetical protein
LEFDKLKRMVTDIRHHSIRDAKWSTQNSSHH